MRTRMYGGVRGRKTKVGGKSTFVFLLLDMLNNPKKFLSLMVVLLHTFNLLNTTLKINQ